MTRKLAVTFFAGIIGFMIGGFAEFQFYIILHPLPKHFSNQKTERLVDAVWHNSQFGDSINTAFFGFIIGMLTAFVYYIYRSWRSQPSRPDSVVPSTMQEKTWPPPPNVP